MVVKSSGCIEGDLHTPFVSANINLCCVSCVINFLGEIDDV